MAAREFGGQPELWQKDRWALLADRWLEPVDLAWLPDSLIPAAIDPTARGDRC